MVYTLEELANLDLKALEKAKKRCTSPTCTSSLTEEEVDGIQMTADGPRCHYCYYDDLGDLIETHGVGLPFRKR